MLSLVLVAKTVLAFDVSAYTSPAMTTLDRHVPGSFCWMELATSDQNSAKHYYANLFGWQAADTPMGPDAMYTIFRLDNRDSAACYTLHKGQRDAGVPPHWMIYVAVENVDAMAQKAGSLGGQVMVPPFDVMDLGRMAVITDPTGAFISMWQSKQHSGIGVRDEEGAFCWADLNTPDPEKASKFYSSLFGWEMMKDPKDTSGYIHIKNGENFQGGIPAEIPPGVPAHWLPYFQTSNCDASARSAQELGGKVCFGPMSLEGVGRFAAVLDPQGAAFAIFQSARMAASQ
ncbi:MAG: VOC family protein [Acetobacteraceae bacterium]|nr:VOC family protein [Acetobacteraceae bacterium]